MTSRAERDLKKAREARKRQAKERAEDQDTLRDRERERAEASERDREAYREREERRQDERERRRREYETRYGRTTRTRPGERVETGRGEMGRELERIAYAVARSNTRLLVGATEVIGNLLINLNDSLWGRPLGGPRYPSDLCDPEEPARARRGAARYDAPDDDFYDDEYEPRARRASSAGRRTRRAQPVYERPRGAYRERSRIDNFVTRSGDVLSDISDDLTQALRDSAAVLSRSAQDVSCILEDVAEPDEEAYDEPEPAEEIAYDAVEEEEWDEAEEAAKEAREDARGTTSTDKPTE
jgi:hypothetical protein